LGLGSRILDLASLVLGPKGFVLGYLVLGVWLRVLCSGSWSWVFGLGFLVLGFWSWLFGLESLVLGVRFQVFGVERFAYDLCAWL
jgi:hypothetical protein